MGLHLVAGTLNQAALARGRNRHGRGRLAIRPRRCSWLFVLTPAISSEVTRVEVAYFTADARAVRTALGDLPPRPRLAARRVAGPAAGSAV